MPVNMVPSKYPQQLLALPQMHVQIYFFRYRFISTCLLLQSLFDMRNVIYTRKVDSLWTSRAELDLFYEKDQYLIVNFMHRMRREDINHVYLFEKIIKGKF